MASTSRYAYDPRRTIGENPEVLFTANRRLRGGAAGRRERDSNPRSFRTTVFKTVAIDHSAIPPGSANRRVAHEW